MKEASNSPADSNLENLKNNSSPEPPKHGGAREGAGRRKGGMNKDTEMRAATKQAMIDRIHGNVDILLNAQFNKALGETYLMVKRTERDSKGKVLRIYHEVVEDKQTIIDYLDGQEMGGEDISDDENYYYMTTKAPDNMALKDLLDRGFGKPDAKLDVTSDGQKLERGASIEEINAILARAEAEAAERAAKTNT